MVGAILLLAGVVTVRQPSPGQIHETRPAVPPQMGTDATTPAEADALAEAQKLKDLICDMERRGKPVPSEMTDRLASLAKVEKAKLLVRFGEIMSESAGKVVDLTAPTLQIREQNGWPATGSILGCPGATESLDFAFRRVEELDGKVPWLEAAAMLALFDAQSGESSIEYDYMHERIKSGAPSLFTNEENLDWSGQPGFHEYYLKQRHNNVLFDPEKQHVSRHDLFFARHLDEQERGEFRSAWGKTLEPILKSPDQVETHLVVSHLHRLYELLQNAARLYRSVENEARYIRSVYQRLADVVAKSYDDAPEVREGFLAAEAKRWGVSDYELDPSIQAFVRIPDARDVMPAILNLPVEAIQLLIKYADPAYLESMRGNLQQFVNGSLEAKGFLASNPQKLRLFDLDSAAIGV